ncbi:TetR family transcriptional regulator, partial [Vibrio parahaemolyticus]|nr:TetR family transcriptional regulator [Vibrio parahaemolyticus]
MPSSRPIQRRGALTRARILDAAAVRFSTRSYEQVGLRDIAADVGVDVALVHRAFGSKEQLFAETLKRTLQPELLNPVDRPLSEHLALKLLKEPAQKKRAPVDPVLMIVRSISHPQAGAIIKRQMQEDFLGPLADKLIEPADQRAALAAGCLL